MFAFDDFVCVCVCGVCFASSDVSPGYDARTHTAA